MRHILSFVIFVELLIVEVNHLEIVIGRLRVASRRNRGRLGAAAINIGNRKRLLVTLYTIDLFLWPTGQSCSKT